MRRGGECEEGRKCEKGSVRRVDEGSVRRGEKCEERRRVRREESVKKGVRRCVQERRKVKGQDYE